MEASATAPKQYNPITVLLISLFFGFFGIDRLYLKDKAFGIIKFATGYTVFAWVLLMLSHSIAFEYWSNTMLYFTGAHAALVLFDWILIADRAREKNANPSGAQTTAAKTFNTKRLVVLSMISTMAFLLAVYVRFQMVPAVAFLRYDPKDIIITIGGFMFGPLAAAAVAVAVAVMQFLTVSGTGPWGLLMNIITSCAFCCTAALIYKYKRNLKGAIIGLSVAAVLTTTIAMLWNYLVVPIYTGIPREAIWNMLFVGFLPFNLIKNGLNAALTMLLYKYVKTALTQAKLMPRSETTSSQDSRLHVGIAIFSLFVVGYILLWVLALQGHI